MADKMTVGKIMFRRKHRPGRSVGRWQPGRTAPLAATCALTCASRAS